jgi:NAD(P)-dependent dehydrogenase (short-subunit alcohol dehydrogenase family)
VAAAVAAAVARFGGIDVLVNNASTHWPTRTVGSTTSSRTYYRFCDHVCCALTLAALVVCQGDLAALWSFRFLVLVWFWFSFFTHFFIFVCAGIGLWSPADTDTRRYNVMMGVNVKGSYLVSRACMPHLRLSPNPHVLTIAPAPMADHTWCGLHISDNSTPRLYFL